MGLAAAGMLAVAMNTPEVNGDCDYRQHFLRDLPAASPMTRLRLRLRAARSFDPAIDA